MDEKEVVKNETTMDSEAAAEEKAPEGDEVVVEEKAPSDDVATAEEKAPSGGEAVAGNSKKFIIAAICVLVVVAAVLLIVFLPKSQSAGNHAVAATVNGVAIYEDDVTRYIETQREQAGLTDSESWGQFLGSHNLTAEGFRKQIIEGKIDQELMRQGAASLGIEVSDAQIDENVQAARSSYQTEEQWQEALDKAGLTEETLRQSVSDMLLQQGLYEHFTESSQPSDEEKLAMAKTYVDIYNGAKKSSHILIKVDSNADEAKKDEARAKAEDILKQLKEGSISFEDAAATFSEDAGSAARGGDVGWDCESTFVEPYQTALSELPVGELSGIVESDYGFHIIKCTGEFQAPEELTSLDQLPDDIKEKISTMLDQQALSNAYSAWIQSLRDSAKIEINDMPSNVSYDVDVSKYTTSTSANGSSAN